MKKKIVVMNPAFAEEHHRVMEKAAASYGYEILFFNTVEEARKDAGDAEILFGHKDDFFCSGKEARWICATSAGVDTFLKNGVIPRDDCILTNSSGAYGLTIAEHLVMVTLMLLRRMDYYEKAMAERTWPAYIPVRSIKNSRITIAGTGDIGSNFAKRLKGFEPSCIIGINRSGICREPAFDQIVRQDEEEMVEQVLKNTDILALCLPSTPQTHGFLSEKRLSMLGNQAIVINVGRGTAIDQAALVRALNDDKIAGAALDVMQQEPIPQDDPLWTAKNCLLTPHCSGNMSLSYTVWQIVDMFCENLSLYCEGKPMHYVVDRNKGY